jgi:tetratricopeptide (TPR) repeat protein
LFYFAAQLMESGWIPLELYFEHRNYLPAMLLFWPIGLALERPGTLRFLRTTAGAAILFFLATLTSQRATLWGNAFHQAQIWAAFNPDSARAQTSAALYDLQNDRPRLAAARLRLAMPRHPDDVQIPVNLITAECKLGAVRPQTIAAARTALANDRVGGEVAFNWFGEALVSVGKHACGGLDYPTLQGMLDAARHNRYWQSHAGLRADLLHLEGTLALAQHQPVQALRDFDAALQQNPYVGAGLSQAATLASAGFPELGLKHLDYLDTLPKKQTKGLGMPRVHQWVLTRQDYWPRETAHLRKALDAGAAAKRSSP